MMSISVIQRINVHTDITVGHLLSHQGGWTQRWGDQMFMPIQVSNELGVPLTG